MHDQNSAGETREDPRVRNRSADINRAMSPAANGCDPPSCARTEYLDFGRALDILQSGGKVARSGWNGRNQFVELQVPDVNSKMSRPYLFISTVNGELVPWVASQTDLLAHDWCLVTERTVLQYGEDFGVGQQQLR